MSLNVGIVGLPNVGKSTLFNALLKRQQAYAANFPFATIEPNIGVVPVPDNRLEKLSKIYDSPIVPATVEFVDIAGLVAGAHKGEGLGNKFLSHIREVDAIVHVVRSFSDKNILKEGAINPKSDFDTIKTELELADLKTKEKRKKKKTEEPVPLLSNKPALVVLNIDETDLRNASKIEIIFAKSTGLNTNQVIAISAKIESELSSLTESDQKKYLDDLGVKESGLVRLITKAFKTLNLITFLTAGEKEVRAWTIKKGMNAQEAAGVIHSEFREKFIKADVCDYADFIRLKGWKNTREAGKVRNEGKDYTVKDGDVVEFKVGA